MTILYKFKSDKAYELGLYGCEFKEKDSITFRSEPFEANFGGYERVKVNPKEWIEAPDGSGVMVFQHDIKFPYCVTKCSNLITHVVLFEDGIPVSSQAFLKEIRITLHEAITISGLHNYNLPI